MKRNLPAFLSGAFTVTLIAALSVSALSLSGRMTIEVDPINVQVNGEVFQPKDLNGNDVPVFSYNGTTYAPLRALAEAYGLTVDYDKERNMATVIDSTSLFGTTGDIGKKEDLKEAFDGDYFDWTTEEETLYKELVEEWEYTYEVLDESKLPDKSIYSGEPKSGKTDITAEMIDKCQHRDELIYRVICEIDTRHKREVVISYPFGNFSSIGSESVWFIK